MTGHAIHIKLDGRTYSGTYKVDRQLLTVTTNYGKKAGQVVPRKPHEALAQELLQELVREEKGRRLNALIRIRPCARSARSPSKPNAARITSPRVSLSCSRPPLPMLMAF